MRSDMFRRIAPAVGAFCAVFFPGAVSPKSAKDEAVAKLDAGSPYPRLNTAPGYEVDPTWPERPPGMVLWNIA